MAFNDGFYWYKNVLKKQLKLALRIYLSIAIILSPVFLMNAANAAVGGWSMSNPIAQGASTVYNGTKQVIIDGKDYIKKGTAKITPPASGVAKVLARGAAGYALSVAVEQLLGAVDWVLDPANNQIKYKPKADPQTCSGYQDRNTMQIFCSAQDFVDSHKQKNNWFSAVVTSVNVRGRYADIYFCFKAKQSDSSCITSMGTTTVITGTDQTEEKTLPLPVVAQKVISNAEGGDAAAQQATTVAAADIVAEAEKDNVKARPIVQQLEASSSTKPADEAAAAESNTATGTQTQNPTKPEATDLKLEFPAFCGWAPVVCEAAQVVISFPQMLTNWWETAKSKAEEWATSISEAWTAAKEWATSEPQEKDPENLDIEDLNIDAEEVNLSGSNNCPQDSVSFSVLGKSVSLDMPYQPVCDALNFFKPAVLLVGAVASVYIVAGIRTKEEDQP